MDVTNSFKHSKLALSFAVDKIKDALDIEDQNLRLILDLCGDIVVPALTIVDNSGVKRIISQSGFSFYQVIGSNNNLYSCFLKELYCNCLNFQNNVILKQAHFICKHLLAINISNALNKTVNVPESRTVIVNHLKSQCNN